MLRLIEWLDLRVLWGPMKTTMMRGGVTLILIAVSSHIIAGLKLPVTPLPVPSPYVLETKDYRMAKSLFRGMEAQSRNESLADAQHCLAQAIYFEARSEPLVGWEAVADVVINRAFSSHYPATICGVVFQGEYRRHKCQFSFACDGLSDYPRNRILWQRTLRMAGSKLVNLRSGPVTARATHYHADYVDPYWTRDMVKLAKIGRHIFYTEHRSADF